MTESKPTNPGAGQRAATAGRKSRTRTETSTQPSETLGGELERRVGRVEFAEGAFVRLRVPIEADDAEPGRDILTDIDVLSIDVDSRLRVTRSVLECKSGAGQTGEPYTLVWLAGFQKLLGLQRAVLVRQTVSRRGRALARRLEITVLDEQAIANREASHRWVPERFGHLDGALCLNAEKRTDVQLKGLPEIRTGLVSSLRNSALLSNSSFEILRTVVAYGRGVTAQGGVPEPASSVLAGHSLVALILAALTDASGLDMFPVEVMKERLGRALSVGDPDDTWLLPFLDRADDYVGFFLSRIHKAYVEQGAAVVNVPVPSLKETIASPPTYVEDYVDFVLRLRANPKVARDLLQTADLVCFDALLGGSEWRSESFHHLFTTEHRGLMLVALRCLGRVAGDQVASALAKIRTLEFSGSAGFVPDRTKEARSKEGRSKIDLHRPDEDIQGTEVDQLHLPGD